MNAVELPVQVLHLIKLESRLIVLKLICKQIHFTIILIQFLPMYLIVETLLTISNLFVHLIFCTVLI